VERVFELGSSITTEIMQHLYNPQRIPLSLLRIPHAHQNVPLTQRNVITASSGNSYRAERGDTIFTMLHASLGDTSHLASVGRIRSGTRPT
jgi:hypothetical protein